MLKDRELTAILCGAGGIWAQFSFDEKHPQWATYTVLRTPKKYRSKNYTVLRLAERDGHTLSSKNSPAIIGKTFYVKGAFPEFNSKPFVFSAEALFVEHRGRLPEKGELPAFIRGLGMEFTLLCEQATAKGGVL